MPGTTRAIVQVCVSLVAGLWYVARRRPVGANGSAAGLGRSRKRGTSTPARPRFRHRKCARSQDANRIPDRDQKLAALRKVQADLKDSVAVFVRQQVDEAILWHLVTQFPERRDEIVRGIRKGPRQRTCTSPIELLGLPTLVGRLLDNKVVLDQAEKALQGRTRRPSPSCRANRRSRRTRDVGPDGPRRSQALASKLAACTPRGRPIWPNMILGSARAQPEADARADRAGRAGTEARQQDRGAGSVSARRRLRPDESPPTKLRFERSIARCRGSDANLEAELDRVYDKHFPNPITPKRYEPPATGAKRVVLLELFTGSACGSLRFGRSVVGRRCSCVTRKT